MRLKHVVVLLLIWLALAGCGGGGGSGGGSTPPINSAAGGGTPSGSLSPVWTLETAAASDLGQTQAEVQSVLDHVFADTATQAALLVLNGYVIGERYAPDRDASSLGHSWSVAKSFYSAAVGVAIDEGWIQSVDQPAADFLTEWQGTAKETITIGNLLEMRGGFAADSSIFFADDQTSFALDFPLTGTPGSAFVYSNPTSQLFEPLLRRATGLDAHAYLRQKILQPIGIDTNLIGMWFDPTGTHPLTYMGLDLTARDMARFGLLYARGGEWDGSQVVSASYVADSLVARSANYGYQWWVLNANFLNTPVPINVSAALGLDGQKIYVWPEADLVLVVQTRYEHNANQGYVLSDSNFPETCTARNSCPGATGSQTPSYDEVTLMLLLEALGD